MRVLSTENVARPAKVRYRIGMAGSPKKRARRAAMEDANGRPLDKDGVVKYQYLADIYAEKYDTFTALRRALIENGIVEHRINPYDVIQRAIDDTTTDYILVRKAIDRDTHGDAELIPIHDLYDYMVEMREAAVRYATFATQYDIQRRQLKLSESRVALLAHTLQNVLQNLGVNPDLIRKVPQLLIEEIKSQEPQSTVGASAAPTRLDETKALAMAEILHHDAEIEVIDIEPSENGHQP